MDILLQVLQDHDIDLGEDDFAWAFDGSETREDAASWVQRYLLPATLLTKDEAAFNEKRAVATDAASSLSGRPLFDAELEAAIASLETSTAAIEKQCEVLESQKQALQEIRSRNACQSSLPGVQANGQKNSAQERAQLDFDIDELFQTTQTHLRSSIRQTDAAISSVPSQIDRILEKDDRLLNGLQKLLPKLSEKAQGGDPAQVEELCSALTKLLAHQTRARLDHIYRQEIVDLTVQQNGSLNKDLSSQQKKQRDTLRAELEELGSEVDGLVAIVVDHQYRKPLRQNVISALIDSQSQKAKWAEYTASALAYITSRLETLNDHVQHMNVHGTALRAVSGTLDDALSVQDASAEASNAAALSTSDRANAKGLKPLRLVQANRTDTQDPALQFLRQQDIRIPDMESTANPSELLQPLIADRKSRALNLSNATELAATDTIARSLAKVHVDAQDLLQAVYAHSKYGLVRLVDDNVQREMDALQHETQQIGDAMRNLDVDALSKTLAAKQDEIVRKLSNLG